MQLRQSGSPQWNSGVAQVQFTSGQVSGTVGTTVPAQRARERPWVSVALGCPPMSRQSHQVGARPAWSPRPVPGPRAGACSRTLSPLYLPTSQPDCTACQARSSLTRGARAAAARVGPGAPQGAARPAVLRQAERLERAQERHRAQRASRAPRHGAPATRGGAGVLGGVATPRHAHARPGTPTSRPVWAPPPGLPGGAAAWTPNLPTQRAQREGRGPARRLLLGTPNRSQTGLVATNISRPSGTAEGKPTWPREKPGLGWGVDSTPRPLQSRFG